MEGNVGFPWCMDCMGLIFVFVFFFSGTSQHFRLKTFVGTAGTLNPTIRSKQRRFDSVVWWQISLLGVFFFKRSAFFSPKTVPGIFWTRKNMKKSAMGGVVKLFMDHDAMIFIEDDPLFRNQDEWAMPHRVHPTHRCPSNEGGVKNFQPRVPVMIDVQVVPLVMEIYILYIYIQHVYICICIYVYPTTVAQQKRVKQLKGG